MLDSFFSTRSLGLFFSGRRLKTIKMSIEKGVPKIDEAATIDLSGDDHVKRLDIANDKTVVSSSLPARDVLVRSLQIELTKKKDVEAVLPFQAEPVIPFPIEEAALDWVEISQSKTKTNLTLLAVKKAWVSAHIEALNHLGIDPEFVSTSPAALATFAKAVQNEGSKQPTLVLHFGLEETLCVLSQEGKLLAEHTLPLGLAEGVSALRDDTGGTEDVYAIDFSSQIVDKHPALKQFTTRLKQEVSRTIFSLVKQHKGEKITRVLLTGQGASLKGIETIFSEGLHVEVVRPGAGFGQTSLIVQEYAIPIGLALGTLIADEPLVNFRKGELSFGDPWKRLKGPILSYFGIAILTAFSLYFLGSAWIGSNLDQVKRDYSQLLETLEIPYSTIEGEVAKMPGEASDGSLKSLTPDQLSERLERIQEMTSKVPAPFELYPNVPRVSDVLGWLAAHPLVTDETVSQPLLNIQNFQYTLVKRPDSKRPNDKYQVKVDIEFTSDTPKLAREFHDALIAPNDLIDPKGEVKWNAAQGRYRTSFYLKNRPPKGVKRSPSR